MTDHVERFYSAVSVLAGDGHIKQRLISAYQENLADLEEDQLPGELAKSFDDLRKRMHSVAPLNGEGPICASVRKMSARQASECAISVVSLYGEILRLTDNIADKLPTRDDDEAPIPPFLVKSAG